MLPLDSSKFYIRQCLSKCQSCNLKMSHFKIIIAVPFKRCILWELFINWKWNERTVLLAHGIMTVCWRLKSFSFMPMMNVRNINPSWKTVSKDFDFVIEIRFFVWTIFSPIEFSNRKCKIASLWNEDFCSGGALKRSYH